MTERPARLISRTENEFHIGPSHLAWTGTELIVDINERTAPIPRPISGRITLRPTALATHIVTLDDSGHHHWSPIAPVADIEVALESPARTWTGQAYLDTNWGTRPLEQDFESWHWCRAALPQPANPANDPPPRSGGGVGAADGGGNPAPPTEPLNIDPPLRSGGGGGEATGGGPGTAILYYTTRKNGTRTTTALHYDRSGTATPFPPPPETVLPQTFWRLPRSTAADEGHQASVLQTLEDAPFYARSILRTHLLAHPVTAMHEMLSLRRFDTTWMRAMLPFKAPRYPLR